MTSRKVAATSLTEYHAATIPPQGKFQEHINCCYQFTQDSWKSVRKEMLSKGLSPEVADRVYDYVGRRSEHKLLAKLQNDPSLASVPAARQGLEELLLLLEYCKAYGVIDKVCMLNNYLVYVCVQKMILSLYVHTNFNVMRICTYSMCV